ncbi:hypothetical protein ACP70R_042414 [Stipagrostis hirtigluma subsp. patula]
MLSCHDSGPYVSKGFRPEKDVSAPEIYLYDGDMPRQLLEPAPVAASRTLLTFFAGSRHGHVRDHLLRHWKDRDPDVFPVYEQARRGDAQDELDYYAFMGRARFCLCPSGYEVASPRVVEAIHAECTRVIVSDGFALPFSVAVPVADIPWLWYWSGYRRRR